MHGSCCWPNCVDWSSLVEMYEVYDGTGAGGMTGEGSSSYKQSAKLLTPVGFDVPGVFLICFF